MLGKLVIHEQMMKHLWGEGCYWRRRLVQKHWRQMMSFQPVAFPGPFIKVEMFSSKYESWEEVEMESFQSLEHIKLQRFGNT